MITDADVKKLKKVFATKDELKRATHPIRQIEQQVKKIDKKLDIAISYFDTVTSSHVKRLNRLEQNAGLPPLAN